MCRDIIAGGGGGDGRRRVMQRLGENETKQDQTKCTAGLFDSPNNNQIKQK